MKPLYCYIAGPLSAKNAKKRRRNIQRAIDAGEAVFRLGLICFIPHLDRAWQLRYPKSWQTWIDFDLCWVKKCDCLLRISGKSPGADVEVQFALDHGIPVYYSLKELRKALAGSEKPNVVALSSSR